MVKMSINIDMGAVNNGVFVAKISNNKIISKSAFNVKFENKAFNFSKQQRTSYRHASRNFDRKRLANRLIDELFPKDFSQREKEFIHGLFKNRGFNYLNVDFKEEIDEDIIKNLDELEDFAFKNCARLEDFESILTKKLEDLDIGEAIDFLNEQKELLSLEASDGKELKKAKKSIISLLNSVQNEISKNNKHRKSYFKDVKKLLNEPRYTQIIEKSGFDKQAFFNIICNVSNLQTRVLRRYFDAKKIDDFKFDEAKLTKKIIDNINFIHYKSAEERQNKQTMLEALKNGVLHYLCTLNPEITIPPYESLNNKHPQKCTALVIKGDLSNELISALNKIFAHEEFAPLSVDENGELHTDFYSLSQDMQKAYLQRFLDVSRDFLQDSALYPRALENPVKAQIFKREIGLNDEEFLAVKRFSTEYYKEVALAKKGVLANCILEPCGKHTPYKNNCKHEHISALFRKQIGEKEAEELEKFVFDKSNKIQGNSTLKGYFARLAVAHKDYTNEFYFALNEEFGLNKTKQSKDKDLKFIIEKYPEVVRKLVACNKDFALPDSLDDSNLNSNLNVLSQLAEILLDDSAGFNKTCKTHTIENRLRSSGSPAFASRLAANSARLINGRVDAFLDKLAYEIVKNLDFTDVENIEINIESNKFSFEKSIKDLTGSDSRRAPKEKTAICPYTGENISEGSWEIDHILPRSKELFNSQANLIPTSSKANLDKSNKKIFLEDLNPKYLDSIMEKCGISDLPSFRTFIVETIDKLDENSFTNYKNLSLKDQIAFRHALFLQESEKAYQKALKLLRKDLIKIPSNGTQKRLTALLVQKIRQVCARDFKFEANVFDAGSQISPTRKLLASANPQIQKQKIQDSHSHCVDASIVFYQSTLKNGVSEFDYFADIYLPNSDIIMPKAKEYLEIKEGAALNKRFFDDSVYAIEFDGEGVNQKDLQTLLNSNLIFTKKSGKKIWLAGMPKDKFFIDTNRVFSAIFAAFENGDKQTLKKLKFLDKQRKTYIKKDIKEIFFDDKNALNDLSAIKNPSKNIAKFHAVLKERRNELYKPSTGESQKAILDVEILNKLYRETFYEDGQGKRARNKTRVTYSLKMEASGAGYVIRRNGGFAGLKNADIATRTYLVGGEIKSVPFHSKNVLPLKIADILDVLSLEKDAKLIYRVDIRDLPSELAKLAFTISEKSRHDVEAHFIKSKFDFDFSLIANDLNTSNEYFKEFCENVLKGSFAKYLGKPRNKVALIKNDDEIFAIKYRVERTNEENKELIKQALNETSNH